MPVSELSPNPRRSTVEYIADELRDAIMAGRLEPGEQLGEADLARRFEVSRGPLREAMQRLVSEGLLHAITNRGVFVTELTLEDVLDVYRTRSVIERGALEVVLDRARREETADELDDAGADEADPCSGARSDDLVPTGADSQSSPAEPLSLLIIWLAPRFARRIPRCYEQSRQS